ncbi:MAG: hypothetical protein RR239_02840 [Oscillospiraceae bacterium]
MKNILFMTESYAPFPSPNGICAKKVADCLHSKGNNTYVITLKNAFGLLENENIDGTNVIRVNENLIDRLIINVSTKGNNKILLKGLTFLSRLKGAVYGLFYPLLSISEVFRYYSAAKKIHKKNGVDVCVSNYHRMQGVLAGVLLKKKYPNIKFIVYTLDCISGGWIPKILHSNKLPLKSLKRWEKIIFKYADGICVMESHRQHYKSEEYNWCRDKIKYMDIPLLELRDNSKKTINKDKVKLVFTGSMSAATANPKYLIKLLKFLPDNYEFHIYGSIGNEIMQNIESSNLLDKKIFCHGRINQTEIAALQNDADVLLNFGCVNANMIPCKIFEYLSAKRPIISFYKADTDSSKPYFENFEDDNEIENNAKKLMEFLKKSNNIKIDDDYVLKRYYNNTPYPMAEEILSE